MGRGGAAMKPADLALGLRLLARLSRSTMSMNRVIEVFPELAPAPWRLPAIQMRAAILRGGSFATALASSIPSFPTPLVALVKAGEAGVGLPAALDRAATEAETNHATRVALVRAATYPLFLLSTAVVAVVILVAIVLPRFAALLNGMSQDLPPAARYLSRVAAIAPGAGIAVAGGIAVSAVMIIAARQDREVRASSDALLLRIPLLGGWLRHRHATIISSTLAALIESSVSLPDALQTCLGLTRNEAINRSLLHARRDILRGLSLSRALVTNDLLPASFGRLVRAGEESGSVVEALQHVAQLCRQHTTDVLRRGIGLIEPATVFGVGGLIAVIAGILLQTIYSIQP